jgi:hypothetical protein
MTDPERTLLTVELTCEACGHTGQSVLPIPVSIITCGACLHEQPTPRDFYAGNLSHDEYQRLRATQRQLYDDRTSHRADTAPRADEREDGNTDG